jgi:hypothetical protein
MSAAATARQVAVVRACAAFDLLVTGLFALPRLAGVFIAVLFTVNGALGGTAAPPPFVPLQWLFVSLTGALGVLWAIVRLLWPQRGLGLAEAAARTWVAGVIAFHVSEGAPAVLGLFVATELGGAFLELSVLAREPVPTALRA